MNWTRIQGMAVAVLAVLTVILLAVAATPVFSASAGGDRPPSVTQPPLDGSASPGEVNSQPGRTVLAALFALGGIGTIVMFLSEPWRALQLVVGVAAGTAGFVVLGWLLLAVVGPALAPEATPAVTPSGATPPTPAGTTGFGSGSASPMPLPVNGGVGLVLLATAVGLLVVFVRRSDGIDAILGRRATDQPEDVADVTALGRAAGAAVERVATAPSPSAADNAIYRAWVDLVELLDVGGPQEATPRQFERAAIATGLEPTDVRVLTRTFEAVRYGDATLTAEQRERVQQAFERIEAAHADTKGETDATTETGPAADRASHATDDTGGVEPGPSESPDGDASDSPGHDIDGGRNDAARSASEQSREGDP